MRTSKLVRKRQGVSLYERRFPIALDTCARRGRCNSYSTCLRATVADFHLSARKEHSSSCAAHALVRRASDPKGLNHVQAVLHVRRGEEVRGHLFRRHCDLSPFFPSSTTLGDSNSVARRDRALHGRRFLSVFDNGPDRPREFPGRPGSSKPQLLGTKYSEFF